MSIHVDKPVSRDLIPAELTPAINRVMEVYQKTFGTRLQSVYIVGGAIRGEYRSGSSDFDLRAIVTEKRLGEKEDIDQITRPLQDEFNIAKMELDVYPVSMLNDRDWLQFYLVHDGICIWGKPYEPTLPLPADKESLAKMLASHLLEHYKYMPETLEKIRTGEEECNPDDWRTFAKRAIRLGNVISILKTGAYTQNSDQMVNNIMKNVPEISGAIAKLNEYRKNPPHDLEGSIDLAREAEVVRATVHKYGFRGHKAEKRPSFFEALQRYLKGYLSL